MLAKSLGRKTFRSKRVEHITPGAIRTDSSLTNAIGRKYFDELFMALKNRQPNVREVVIESTNSAGDGQQTA